MPTNGTLDYCFDFTNGAMGAQAFPTNGTTGARTNIPPVEPCMGAQTFNLTNGATGMHKILISSIAPWMHKLFNPTNGDWAAFQSNQWGHGSTSF